MDKESSKNHAYLCEFESHISQNIFLKYMGMYNASFINHMHKKSPDLTVCDLQKDSAASCPWDDFLLIRGMIPCPYGPEITFC